MEIIHYLLWMVIWLLVMLADIPDAASIPLHLAMCVAPGEEQVLSLGCPGEKQLQVITVYFGKTPSWRASFYNCDDPVVLSIDWLQLDTDLTESVRETCNSFTECQAQVSYPSVDPAPENYDKGITFINADYQCRTVIEWGGEPPDVMHPMTAEVFSFLAEQLTLQSSDYPSMTELTTSSQCHLVFPQRNKVRLDVHDFSYENRFITAPYSLRWSSGQLFPLPAAAFQTYYFYENTTIIFESLTDDVFNGRFWMTLTIYTAGGLLGYGSMNVTCMPYTPTSPATTTSTTSIISVTTNNTEEIATSQSSVIPSNESLPAMTTVTSSTELWKSTTDTSSTVSNSQSTEKPQTTNNPEATSTQLQSVYNSFTTPTLAHYTPESNQGSTGFLTNPRTMSSEQQSMHTTHSVRSVYTPSPGTSHDGSWLTTPQDHGSSVEENGVNGVVIGSLSAVIFIIAIVAILLAIFLCNKRRKRSKVRDVVVSKRKRRGRRRMKSTSSLQHSNTYEESKIVLEPLPPIQYDEYTEIHETPSSEIEPTHTIRMFYKNAPSRDEHNTLYVNQHVADHLNESRRAPPPPRPRSRTLPSGGQITILNRLNLIPGRTQAKVPTSSTSSDIAIIENLTHT